MLSELKPQSKLLVYDLVTQAGVDTSDWANFDGVHPASNPRYCYNWAFWDDAKKTVVLCLWFEEMKPVGEAIYQSLNYRGIAASRRLWNATQRKRAANMDFAIQLAKNKRLPIRVIVVDGSRRNDGDDKSRSRVERRMLDPEPWHVAAYDDDGNCRLQRGPSPAKKSPPELENMVEGSHRLARIAYNSSGWKRPTGDAKKCESPGTYNFNHGFGHEEWLFRAEWKIDGWRYAFIQGLNKNRIAYLGQSLNVTFYTLQPDKRRRLVATIYGLESLSDAQAEDALNAFRKRGWFKTMQDEVRAIGGNADALGDPKSAEHVLNVRFRLENVELYPTVIFLPDDEWIEDRHRYMLYKFVASDQERVEKSNPSRQGSHEALETRRLFRRGTKPIEYTPEHDKMQAKLMAELQEQYGREQVRREQDFVDVRVQTDKELIYFEIKTDLDPRAVIRQALGQILEYAYHPARAGRRPDSLVLVGRTGLGSEEEAYLRSLCEKFHLPLSYRVVTI